MLDKQDCDVAIIGGGPAGSTAAALLAQKGRRVMLFEKEKFPRYHIGESLIPFTYFVLQRLGVLDKMNASRYPRKYSVQFVRTDGNVSTPFYFFTHMKHDAAVTWQVVRSEFDQMLLDNAREKGAAVFEQTRVTHLIQEGGQVCGLSVQDASGCTREVRAPMTIDASGRDSFAVARNNWRMWDPRLNKIAIWTYYQGAMRDPGIDEGATTVAYIPEKGWFWYIPWPDDKVSVGVVADKDYLYRDPDVRDLEAIFNREILANEWIKKHLACGKPCDKFRTTGEYSYRSRHCATHGLLLAGDAFGFLDPVFSSGVLLALRSGEMAADAVDAALAAGDVSAGRFEQYGQDVRRGIESMRRLVYAFYDLNFRFRALFDKHPEMRGDVTDTLMGKLFDLDSRLQKALAEFATIPEPLPYGQPLQPEVAASR